MTEEAKKIIIPLSSLVAAIRRLSQRRRHPSLQFRGWRARASPRRGRWSARALVSSSAACASSRSRTLRPA